eukprot:8663964-Pyramimonas_sp.AAC.1
MVGSAAHRRILTQVTQVLKKLPMRRWTRRGVRNGANGALRRLGIRTMEDNLEVRGLIEDE